MLNKTYLISFILMGQSMLLLTNAISQTIQPWTDDNTAIFAAASKSGTTGRVLRSVDGGYTWKMVWDGQMDSQSGFNRMNAVACGNGKVVAVGNTLLVSEDRGNTWTETIIKNASGYPMFEQRNYLRTVAYGNGFFVAAGLYNYILYSKDGKNWKYVKEPGLSSANTQSPAKNTGSTSKPSLSKINKGLKAGNLMKNLENKSTGNSSSNSTQSVEKPKKTEGENSGIRSPRHMIFADGRFYLVGGSGHMDGAIFEIQGEEIVKVKGMGFSGNAANFGGSGSLEFIAWDGKSTLVTVSNAGRSAYSTDMGTTWKYIYQPGNKQGLVVGYGFGKWTGISPFRELFYSTDITNGWDDNFVVRQGERQTPQGMIYVNDRFVVAGNDNVILASENGETWEIIHGSKIGTQIYDIAAITW